MSAQVVHGTDAQTTVSTGTFFFKSCVLHLLNRSTCTLGRRHYSGMAPTQQELFCRLDSYSVKTGVLTEEQGLVKSSGPPASA